MISLRRHLQRREDEKQPRPESGSGSGPALYEMISDKMMILMQ